MLRRLFQIGFFCLAFGLTAFAGDPEKPGANENKWRRLWLEDPPPFSGGLDALMVSRQGQNVHFDFIAMQMPPAPGEKYGRLLFPQDHESLADFMESEEVRALTAGVEKKRDAYLQRLALEAQERIRREGINIPSDVAGDLRYSMQRYMRPSKKSAAGRATERAADQRAMNEARVEFGSHFNLRSDREQQRWFNRRKNQILFFEEGASPKPHWTRQSFHTWQSAEKERIGRELDLAKAEWTRLCKQISRLNCLDIWSHHLEADPARLLEKNHLTLAKMAQVKTASVNLGRMNTALRGSSFNPNPTEQMDDILKKAELADATEYLFEAFDSHPGVSWGKRTPRLSEGVQKLFWAKFFEDPSYWNKREAVAVRLRSPAFTIFSRGEGEAKGPLSLETLKGVSTQMGNPEDPTPLLRRGGSSSDELFFELGESPKRDDRLKPMKLERPWFGSWRKSTQPTLTFSSAAPIRSTGGFIPLPTAEGYQLSQIELRDSKGKKIPIDVDFELQRDPTTGNQFLRIFGVEDPDGYHFTAGYKPAKVRALPRAPSIPREKILALNTELRSVGLTELADKLDALAQPDGEITPAKLRAVFEKSGLYTRSEAAEFLDPKALPENDFKIFAPFVNENGIACYQCAQSNSLFATYLGKAVAKDSGFTARTASGFYSRSPLVTLGNLHRITKLETEGHAALELDATPSTREPARAQRASGATARNLLNRLRAAKNRYLSAARATSDFHHSTPWIRAQFASEAATDFLDGKISLTETAAKLKPLGIKIAEESDAGLLKALSDWSIHEQRALRKTKAYANQLDETVEALPYQNGLLTDSVQARLSLLEEVAEISPESIAIHRKAQMPANCGDAYKNLGFIK